MFVETLDRNAAYVAARTAAQTIRDATTQWPPDVARTANKVASDVVVAVLDALREDPTSAARRKLLRGAVCHALELAAICDIAIAHGLKSAQVEESLRCASRTLSLLGMSFHATAAGCD